MSRLARILLLALATALLLYYHSTILSVSGVTWESQGETTTVIQIPISQPPSTSSGDSKDASSPGTTGTTGTDDSPFNEAKFAFQDDLVEYRQPKIDIASLKKYAPHNDHGPGQFAYATYLSTRNNSIHDPYFLSAQQLIYRLLWDPKSRSAFHPIVVFVAPFIPQQQRDILAAQGAIVRELDLVPWDPPPNEDGSIFPFARWKDLFSKLNIWGQTEFSRVVFLDLDAFPVQNVDAIFTEAVAPRQRCKPELLPPEDKPHEADICEYVFAGSGLWDGINVGVVVLEPNKAMHARLLRESQDTSKFDNKMAEQAFLNYAFSSKGPFPYNMISREWNGYYPQEGEKDFLKIVHEKLWIFGNNTKWTTNIFRDGWDEILALYESPQFEALRKQDGLVAS